MLKYQEISEEELAEFLKEAEKIGLEVGLIRGEDLNRDIENTLSDKRMMDLYRTIASAK